MSAYFNDMISGTPKKTFGHNQKITREELSVILNNILVPVESRIEIFHIKTSVDLKIIIKVQHGREVVLN